jgi:hypothetical protein
MTIRSLSELTLRVGDHLRPSLVYPNGVSLSIQASRYHYCSPREDQRDLCEYVTVEIAVLKDGALTRPESVGLSKYADLWEAGDHAVAGYVDVATVVEIVNALTEVHGEWQISN